MLTYDDFKRAIRQPRHFLNTTKSKLVFVYPFVFSDVLDSYNEDVRLFFAKSILQQAFYQNAEQLIQQIANSEKQESKQGLSSFPFAGSFMTGDEYEKRQVLEKKVRALYDAISKDPSYRKLLPVVGLMTTGEGFYDVPVFVGSKSLTADTTALSLLLLISIAFKQPLDDYNRAHKLIEMLKRQEPDQLARLISIQLKLAFRESNRLSPKFARLKQLLQNLFKSEVPPDENNPALFKLVDYLKNKLNELDRIMKFILDPRLLRSIFGIETTTDFTSNYATINLDDWNETSPQVASVAISQISSNYLNIILSLIAPVYSANSNTELERYAQYLFDKVTETFDKITDQTVKSAIEGYLKNIEAEVNVITGELNVNDKELLAFTDNCDSSKTSDLIEKIQDTIRKYINHIDLIIVVDESTLPAVSKNLVDIAKLATKCKGFNNTLERTLSLIMTNGSKVFKEIDKKLSNTISEVLQSSLGKSENCQLCQFQSKSNVLRYVNDATSALVQIFKTQYYIALLAFLCERIRVVKQRLQIRKTDISDFPNYAMVLPANIAQMVHSIVVSHNWEHFIKQPVPSDYGAALSRDTINAAMKFITNTAKVPNLILIDEESGKFYYKFMYMSKIETITISQMKDFARTAKPYEIADVTQEPPKLSL